MWLCDYLCKAFFWYLCLEFWPINIKIFPCLWNKTTQTAVNTQNPIIYEGLDLKLLSPHWLLKHQILKSVSRTLPKTYWSPHLFCFRNYSYSVLQCLDSVLPIMAFERAHFSFFLMDQALVKNGLNSMNIGTCIWF
jgi:hypothetical protein